MDIAAIPFHRLLGIRVARLGEDGMLVLDDTPALHNHLDTVHASAQYALAEACSGALLADRFPDLAAGVLPVVRRAEVKYRRPARGTLTARASLIPGSEARVRDDLAAKGRTLVDVAAEVVDAGQTVVLSATLHWFLQRVEDGPALSH